MSKLLAGGCSWTQQNFHTDIHPGLDCSWKKWPELVLGDWDEVVNLGRGGSGLDYMLPLLMEYIMEHDDVSHLILQFTSWYRWMTPERFFHNPTLALSKHNQRPHSALKNQWMRPTLTRMEQIENFFPTTHRSVQYRLNNYLILLNALVELCLYKNIKFIGWQGLHFAHSKLPTVDRTAYKYFVNHRLFHKLDTLNNSGKIEFLNWPLVDTMSDCMDKILPKECNPNRGECYGDGHRISASDSHPNKKGHEFIAEWINQNASTI